MAQTKGASKKFDPEAAQAAMNAAAPAEVNTAEVKETATEVKKAAAKKPAAKKAPAKKAATAKAPAKKATATKAPAKKATAAKAPAKKAAAKAAPAEAKANVTVQFRGKEYTMDNFVKIVKDIWVYDLKKDLAEFKEVEVYVKPDECMAYYVVNGTEMGGFPI